MCRIAGDAESTEEALHPHEVRYGHLPGGTSPIPAGPAFGALLVVLRQEWGLDDSHLIGG